MFISILIEKRLKSRTFSSVKVVNSKKSTFDIRVMRMRGRKWRRMAS